jgi:hypothetical protein
VHYDLDKAVDHVHDNGAEDRRRFDKGGMNGAVQPRDHARRNRITAMAAGAITVIAIVLGFAGDLLGPPWHWMRPAAELLLLPVGRTGRTRNAISSSKPVHEKVSVMEGQIAEMRTTSVRVRFKPKLIICYLSFCLACIQAKRDDIRAALITMLSW